MSDVARSISASARHADEARANGDGVIDLAFKRLGLRHSIENVFDGIVLWLGLQRRAGLSGDVLVASIGGSQDDLRILEGADADEILRAILSVIDGGSGEPAQRKFYLAIIDGDPSSGRVHSAIVRDAGYLSTNLGELDDDDREAIERYLNGRARGLPAGAPKVGGLTKVRALRAFAPTVEGALTVDSDFSGDEDDCGDSYHVFVPLEEPISGDNAGDTNLFISPAQCQRQALWPSGYHQAIRLEPFEWSVDALSLLFSACWARRLGRVDDAPLVSFSHLEEKADDWRRVNGNAWLYRLAHPARAASKTEFLVPGIIAKGEVTVLAASPGVGKSALALHLASLVGIPADRREGELPFLGVPATEIGHGEAVLITGEESHAELDGRRSKMRVADGGHVLRLSLVDDPDESLDNILRDLQGLERLALVVIDSMRALCPGDLDRSEIVGPFMAKLQAFARRKGCPVLLIHHLNKNAGRRPGRGLVDDIHGSGAVVSAARAVLTMRERADGVSVRVELSKLADVQKRELGPFIQDAATYTLMPQSRGKASRSPTPVSDDTSMVATTLETVLRAGHRVTRTGKHELYEMKRPEMAGISRNKIRAAIEAAIQEGRVHLEEDGALSISTAE